jgi:hypothetical protein
MNVTYRLTITGLFFFVVFAVCCFRCPEWDATERGVFQIQQCEYDTSLVTNGTIEIRETEVEIQFVDDEGQSWIVLYDITGEYP